MYSHARWISGRLTRNLRTVHFSRTVMSCASHLPFALLLMLAPWFAAAQTLSFSTGQDGNHLATISMQAHPCVVLPMQPSSVVVEAGRIAISAPAYPQVNCGPPPPPWPIRVATVSIGRLSPGTYSVTWSQAGDFEVSGTLAVAPHRVPSMSPWSLALLVIAVVVLASGRIRADRWVKA